MSSSLSLHSFGDNTPTKKHSAHFNRGIFSSPRVKKRTKRSTIMGDSYDSRWSLFSGNSLSTEDFNWSLQPNYLKMMNDTNLIDNCAAAEEEIESIRGARQQQFLETNKLEKRRFTVDPEQLLQWIRYMEKYLEAFSPNWKQVEEMNATQRDASLNEQCDLRQYIASHNGIFNQMVKEDDSQRTRDVLDKYHLLLLNAIEKQCLLEGYPKVDDKQKMNISNRTSVNLDIYKLCDIDIEPQKNVDYAAIRSTESSSPNSDITIVTSDDGINFPTHPTTSKSSLFSEGHWSPFSSDFKREEHESWENVIKELDDIEIDSNFQSSSTDLPKSCKQMNSSLSESTLKLIEGVDLVLPRPATPNIGEYLDTTNKVDDWLFNHSNTTFTSAKKIVDENKKTITKICTSSSGSDIGSTLSSIQWDNFQDIYSITAPIEYEANNDFLYFGDDYDNVLKCGSSSSILDMIKSSTSCPTTPTKSEGTSDQCKDETIVPTEMRVVNRKKKRTSRKLNMPNDPVIPEVPKDTSIMARDILHIVEDLRNNYMNLKPRDFDGILKICRENLGCLIVVLDKDQRSHYRSNESIESVGDDRIYIQENCQCGIIGKFVARIVWFLYDCSRKVRRSGIYRFLLKILKNFYAMVKFFSKQVRFYRALYGKY